MTLADELIKESHPSPSGEGKGVSLFLAKLVFNIVTNNANKRSQFQEQLLLVQAESMEEAFLKARALGIGREKTIARNGLPATSWEFVDLYDLLPVPSLSNGSEIYSQIHETEEAREYIHNVHQRGMAIRLNVVQNS